MSEPRTKIFITVEQDDEQVFAGEYYSVESLEEDLYKVENITGEYSGSYRR